MVASICWKGNARPSFGNPSDAGYVAYGLGDDDERAQDEIRAAGAVVIAELALALAHEHRAITEGMEVSLVDDAHVVIARERRPVPPLDEAVER